MALWFVAMSSVIVLASRWAWRYRVGRAGLIRVKTARPLGGMGTSTDVQLTSVVAWEPVVLVEFQETVATLYATGRPPARPGQVRHSLVCALEGDAAASVALMRGWEASGIAVVMWRAHGSGRVELSRLRTGQRVALSVVPDVVTASCAPTTSTSWPTPPP